MTEIGGNGLLLDRFGLAFLRLRDDAELTIDAASPGFYAMLGCRQGEIAALRACGAKAVLRDANPAGWDALGRSAGDGFRAAELKLIKKDGHHIWIRYRMRYAEKDGAGYFWGVVDDITLARRSQRIQREQKEELEALTANIPGGVLRYRADESLSLDFVSEGFCRITGYSEEEIAERFGNRFIEMVCPQDRGMLLDHILGMVPWDGARDLTFRVAARNGELLWMMDKTRGILCGDGIVWVYSVLIDVTAMKKAEDELRASEERYRLILEHVNDPVADCNFKTEEIYLSPAFRAKFPEVFRSAVPEDIGRVLRETDFICGADRSFALNYADRIMAGACVPDAEIRLRSRDGSYLWCSVHPTLFGDGSGGPGRLIVVLSDIDRQKKETMALKRKAEHDLLTGLYNRVTTMTLVNEAIAGSARGERHALFVIDIDNFKKINDSFGHLAGDRLIAGAAAKLRALFRSGDIVGRVGGDEFAVFMKRADSESVLRKAETLNRSIVSLGREEKVGVPVSGSVGAAFFPGDGKSYDELFRKADTAMYAAKNSGKNSFRVYFRGMGFSGPPKPESAPRQDGAKSSLTARIVSSGVPSASAVRSAAER